MSDKSLSFSYDLGSDVAIDERGCTLKLARPPDTFGSLTIFLINLLPYFDS